MRQYSLTLLLALLPLISPAQAEESTAVSSPPAAATSPTTDQIRIDELTRDLADIAQQRNELAAQLEGSQAGRESQQLVRLRQENQELKQQVREALSSQAQSPLSDIQTWYLIGAATSLLAVLMGALLRGSRKKRREWLN